MHDFNFYLESIGEIGFVERTLHSIVYISGLPEAHPGELVIFESGEIGQVFSLDEEYVEVLIISGGEIRVGSKVVRTGKNLNVPVGKGVLGRVIDPIGRVLDDKGSLDDVEYSAIERNPPKIIDRNTPDKPMETGVSMVDVVIPLAKGQRELIIGDRKTGKTEFLLQTMISQAKRGSICIYAVIGQKRTDILNLAAFISSQKTLTNTVLVAASSSETSGLIYLTPFTAMSIAEHFQGQGLDVLLILDDMTTHAKIYREISLLGRRFPGRSSYPGDIFYLHAKLVERAGNFKKGSITLLPVAESLLGDLSGYIQTNLMAMTDGHLFFDIDLYNEGKRPAVNPFLSVTRVGRQVQTKLMKDVGREVTSFLVTYDKMKQFLHFGAEVGQAARNVLLLGGKVEAFLNQSNFSNMDINLNILILGGIWAGIWNEVESNNLKRSYEQIILNFNTNDVYHKQVTDFVSAQENFSTLITNLRREGEIIKSKL
jgi:F-type H+/Na+-transporting ATPase subunit alpha